MGWKLLIVKLGKNLASTYIMIKYFKVKIIKQYESIPIVLKNYNVCQL